MRVSEPVSFWRGKRDGRRHFTSSFYENVAVAKTRLRNVRDLAFLKLQKGLAIIIIQNNFVQFVAHKE